jgi:hypothetical protein
LDWSINLKQDWMKHKKFLLSIFKSSNLIQENIEFEEFLHMVSRIESNGFGMYYQSKGREILFGRGKMILFYKENFRECIFYFIFYSFLTFLSYISIRVIL